MKNLKKGLIVGLPIGGALMIAISLVFMNFFPDAILDNKSVTTILVVLAVLAVAVYKALNIAELINNPGCDDLEFKVSEPIEIVIDYSGKSQLYNPMTSDASSLDWGEELSEKILIVKRKAYLLDLCGGQYYNLAIKVIEAQGFVPAVITELKFFSNPLEDAEIIALGSIAKDKLTNSEMIAFLKKDGTIGKTWLGAKSFQEDRFLVFKKDEEGVVITPNDKGNGLPTEASDGVIVNAEPTDEKSAEEAQQKEFKDEPSEKPREIKYTRPVSKRNSGDSISDALVRLNGINP